MSQPSQSNVNAKVSRVFGRSQASHRDSRSSLNHNTSPASSSHFRRMANMRRSGTSNRTNRSRWNAKENAPFFCDLILLAGPPVDVLPRQGRRVALNEHGHVLNACHWNRSNFHASSCFNFKRTKPQPEYTARPQVDLAGAQAFAPTSPATLNPKRNEPLHIERSLSATQASRVNSSVTTNPNNELPLDQENDRPVCSPNDHLLPVPIISEVLEITESFDDDISRTPETACKVAEWQIVIYVLKVLHW